MFERRDDGVSDECRLAAWRGRPPRAVPALDGDFLHTTHRDPDVSRRDAGGERLLGRAVAQLDDDGVTQEHAAKVSELVGDGARELAELQKRVSGGD